MLFIKRNMGLRKRGHEKEASVWNPCFIHIVIHAHIITLNVHD